MMDKKETIQDKAFRLEVMSTLVNRMGLAANMGLQSFGGARDLYTALGYPAEITFGGYYARYDRQDIAKAIIDRPVKYTWQGELSIQESNDEKETKLEKAWKNLYKDFKLRLIFTRLDKLTGIGEYGILLFGLSDVSSKPDWIKPAGKSTKLLYLKPYSQGSVSVAEYESDANNKRFGMPKYYKVVMQETEEGKENEIKVHWSRILHVIDDALESEVVGTPRLKPVFNRLMDLEKIVGGDAEMFWKGARPGYAGRVDKDYQMTPEVEEDLKIQLDEYEHNLRRILVNEGIDYKALTQEVADPANHVDIQIQMISAQTGIPKRILTGSERGELSSSQDTTEWKSFISSRREDYAEMAIIRPFLDKCIELNLLPAPTEQYNAVWTDLFALSDKEKVEIGKSRTDALKAYTGSPLAADTIPPDAFLTFFLGLNDNQIELIKEMKDAALKQEPIITPEEQAAIDEQAALDKQNQIGK